VLTVCEAMGELGQPVAWAVAIDVSVIRDGEAVIDDVIATAVGVAIVLVMGHDCHAVDDFVEDDMDHDCHAIDDFIDNDMDEYMDDDIEAIMEAIEGAGI
jgi:hypothetical protein